MKIIGIGRNYSEHAKELNHALPAEPIVFLKPDTALLRGNAPFYYPEFSQDIHHEVEVVVKICKEGKYIQEKFAHKYYEEIALGIDFTARDLQKKAQEQGLPWTLAKGFNGSAPISEFISKQGLSLHQLPFSLHVNGTLRQTGNTEQMVFSIDYLIAYVSQFITLKTGDYLFTGTPPGVASVKPGDRLQAYLQDRCMLDFEVR
ncbi:MAG: fumarylacetoacetate hydrolase family protein [Cytophagaceae bacterium]|jgi:2-keto-4-pentenoate hydratase/2-oxohepta-3-ene-1,7-dioic acid hydratase in catechol pathway|nr:fumarylacetoacetate hydrolase family protein [Cytophagaceae bacterium]